MLSVDNHLLLIGGTTVPSAYATSWAFDDTFGQLWVADDTIDCMYESKVHLSVVLLSLSWPSLFTALTHMHTRTCTTWLLA